MRKSHMKREVVGINKGSHFHVRYPGTRGIRLIGLDYTLILLLEEWQQTRQREVLKAWLWWGTCAFCCKWGNGTRTFALQLQWFHILRSRRLSYIYQEGFFKHPLAACWSEKNKRILVNPYASKKIWSPLKERSGQ